MIVTVMLGSLYGFIIALATSVIIMGIIIVVKKIKN